MKIWVSNDKELRFTEVDDNYITVNLFTDDFIIGVMITRREAERLCLSLAEWCGIPLGER
tara:strand:+ start:665 stop:844 length:180 start_codon:yes stop_codon:yes gene_type:complete